MNGYELGGGSLRINQKDLQERMLKALGFSEESAYEQFGFLLEAMDYGFPPHGGLAIGLDRFVIDVIPVKCHGGLQLLGPSVGAGNGLPRHSLAKMCACR